MHAQWYVILDSTRTTIRVAICFATARDVCERCQVFNREHDRKPDEYTCLTAAPMSRVGDIVRDVPAGTLLFGF